MRIAQELDRVRLERDELHRQVQHLRQAVEVAREARDSAESRAKESVQAEMAMLRRELAEMRAAMQLTPEERAAVEALRRIDPHRTPGPWYAHNPDDEVFMNVLLVSDSPDAPNMGEPPDDEIEYGKVIALTLFQSPRVVCHESDKWDENAWFIAAAGTHMTTLLGAVERLAGRRDGT